MGASHNYYFQGRGLRYAFKGFSWRQTFLNCSFNPRAIMHLLRNHIFALLKTCSWQKLFTDCRKQQFVFCGLFFSNFQPESCSKNRHLPQSNFFFEVGCSCYVFTRSSWRQIFPNCSFFSPRAILKFSKNIYQVDYKKS